MGGRWLALADLGHWYETAMVILLILLSTLRIPLAALAVLVITYAAVVVADNALPRARWRVALATAWGVGGTAAVIALVTAQLAAGGGLLP
jgi:hypothetical protein